MDVLKATLGLPIPNLDSRSEPMLNDMLMKLVLSLLTDENLKKMILPVKAELLGKLEAASKASPEIYDDVLVRILKIILGE